MTVCPDVFVMGAFRVCLFCMSVCIMYVCRIYILDVCVFDDCVAIVGVQHLSVFNAQIWNVCLQNVCDQCLFGEWLCSFNILFLMGSFVLDASVRVISVWWMAEFSLCISRISALDECLLDNCLKNVRVLNASVQNVACIMVCQSMIQWLKWLCGGCGCAASLCV